jgi:hypothetical protein
MGTSGGLSDVVSALNLLLASVLCLENAAEQALSGGGLEQLGVLFG